MCLRTKTEREGKRGKGRRGREGVNENFWFKKCDIINNCLENWYTGTGTGLQLFFKPKPVQKSRPVPCLVDYIRNALLMRAKNSTTDSKKLRCQRVYLWDHVGSK